MRMSPAPGRAYQNDHNAGCSPLVFLLSSQAGPQGLKRWNRRLPKYDAFRIQSDIFLLFSMHNHASTGEKMLWSYIEGTRDRIDYRVKPDGERGWPSSRRNSKSFPCMIELNRSVYMRNQNRRVRGWAIWGTKQVSHSTSHDRPDRRVRGWGICGTKKVSPSTSHDRPAWSVRGWAIWGTKQVSPSTSHDRPAWSVRGWVIWGTKKVSPSTSHDRPSRRVRGWVIWGKGSSPDLGCHQIG